MCSILKMFKASGIIIMASLLLMAPTACMSTHPATGIPTNTQISTSSNDVKIIKVYVISTATLEMASFVSQEPYLQTLANSVSTLYSGNYVVVVKLEATQSAKADTPYTISLVPQYAGMSSHTGFVNLAPIEVSQQAPKAIWFACSDLEGQTLINAHPGDTENLLIAYSYTSDIQGLYSISVQKAGQ